MSPCPVPAFPRSKGCGAAPGPDQAPTALAPARTYLAAPAPLHCAPLPGPPGAQVTSIAQLPVAGGELANPSTQVLPKKE